MNPTKPISLTRSQLLRVDQLADQLESSLQSDPVFDAENFLAEVDDPQVALVLRDEYRRLQQRRPTFVSASSTLESRPIGRSCAVAGFEPGMVIDDFELLALVGRGSTSVVWKARNRRLNRDVALKFPTVFSNSIASRIERESQAVARLSHPNIATIYESRNHGSGSYLVTEYIEGASLQCLIETRELSIDESVSLLIQVTEAIAYSHSMKVIHRDLKPQNILIREDGSPVVVDFGLARVLLTELAVLTQEGDFIGTPGYMSPEQAAGHSDVDERIDVYALGVLMFQLLTQQLPFTGNVQSVVHQIIHEPPPLPSAHNPHVGVDLDTICHRCMSKDPQDRFQSATELALELRRFQNGESIRSRRASRIEKLVRWSLKKPIEAALSLSLLLCLLALAIGATNYAVSMRTMRDKEYDLRLKAEQSELAAQQLKLEVEAALEESERQKEFASDQAFENKAAVDFLKSVFQDTAPIMWVLKGDGIGSGKPPTLKQIFENAADGLEHGFAGSDQTKANLLDTLGDSCRAGGYLELARRLLEQSKEIRDNALEQRPNDPNAKLDSLDNQLMFAKLDHDLGDYQLARRAYEDCLQTMDGIKTDVETGEERLFDVETRTRFHYGRLLLTLQHKELARSQFQTVIELNRRARQKSFVVRASEVGLEFCDADPQHIPATKPIEEFFQKDSWAQEVVEGFAIQTAYRTAGDWGQAAKKYEGLLVLLRERLPIDNRWYLMALGDSAGVQLKAGHYEQACKNAESAIAAGEKISPGHPQLLAAKLTLGKELIRAQRIQDGVNYLKSVDDFLVESQRGSEVQIDLLMELSEGLIELDRHDAAATYVERLKNRTQGWSSEMVAWLRYLEFQTFEFSDPNRAQRAKQEALVLAREMKEPPENGIWCSRMARILQSDQLLEHAEQMARAGVDFDSRRFFSMHPRVANRRMLLGEILMKRGNVSEAKKAFEVALASRKIYLSPDNHLVHQARVALETAAEAGQNQSTTPVDDSN
ncbi:MAG: serine/threonine-protein kinase [Planctomycetota bacterium]